MLVMTPLRYSWGLTDDYMVLLSPAIIVCAAGDCNHWEILEAILFSGIVISAILTVIFLVFSTIRKGLRKG